MRCPSDGATLAKETYESATEVDRCPDCSGIWLDHRELETIQETLSNDYTEELANLPNLVGRSYAMALDRSRPLLSCPSCSNEMERREHGFASQVMIDVCPSCRGVWLDRGEIQTLEVFFERSKLEADRASRGFFTSLRDFFS